MISAASAASAGLGVLERRVADPVLAGHEDHRARDVVGDAHRVVRGAGGHQHERLAGRRGGGLERADDPLVERGRGSVCRSRNSAVHAAPRRGLLGERGDVARDAAVARLVDAADVEREADPLRDRR